MAYPQGPYEPPPPYNPSVEAFQQAPAWGPQPAAHQGAAVFNPDAQGYVKQGSTYYASGPAPVQGGYYPPTSQPVAPGFYPQPVNGPGYGPGYGPMPPPQGGMYPGQPVTTAPGYYGAAGYPAATTTVVQDRRGDGRCDDLTKCCLGTCCLTWLCCWLTD